MPPWLNIPTLPDDLPTVLRQLLSGRLPSTGEFVAFLDGLGAVEAGVLLLAGLVFLLLGYQTFRLLVIANAAFFGGLGGALLANRYAGKDMVLFGMLVGGLLSAVLALPLIRHTVAAVGAWVGGLLGYRLWPWAMVYLKRVDLLGYSWVGAVIGMVVLGVICFVAFRALIMIVTATEGGLLTSAGASAVCFRITFLHDPARHALTTWRFLLPTVIAVLTVVGFALQHHAWRTRTEREKLREATAPEKE